MKKIVVLLFATSVFLLASSSNEYKIIKELSIISVLNHMDLAEKNKLEVGYKYLDSVNERLWLKKRSNEFEADEIRLVYYDKLIDAAKKAKSKYMNKKLTFTNFATFGKYDFKEGGFPVKIKTEGEKSVLNLVSYGTRYFSTPFLVLTNLDTSNIILKMNKAQAKEFLKNGRDRNRRLKAVFTGYIRDVKVCNTSWKKIKYHDPDYKNNRLGSTCLMFDNKELSFTDL